MRNSPAPIVSIDFGNHRARVLAARDALVREHLWLVPPIAHRIKLTLPRVFAYEDLLAEGNLGLVHVATRYRPQQHGGAPFSAFARPRIRGAILDSVRRQNFEESTRPSIDEDPERFRNYIHAVPDTDRRLDRRRMGKRLADAIQWLPERQRVIVRAYYSGDRASLAVIGAALGLTEYKAERERAEAIAELRRRLAWSA